MKVLVDFDNVPVQVRNQGLLYLVDRIVTCLGPTLRQIAVKGLEFRMYGGWDENNNLTKRAQQLSADLQSSFPRIATVTDAEPFTRLHLSGMLAQSLEVLPSKILHNTLRSIPVEKQFACIKPTSIGCANRPCPIDSLADFLKSGTCPISGCRFTPMAVLKLQEQKLVDTMIVADLIHLSKAGQQSIVLVSSDDDMWPGILSVLAAGTHIIHVQTKGIKHSLPYKPQVSGQYTQLEL